MDHTGSAAYFSRTFGTPILCSPEKAEKLQSLPGKPEAILLPGRTPGNVSILLPRAGAVAVGDSFVSGHPISPKSGPQMLHRMYHSDPVAALASARLLESVQAKVILPGHGPALHMPLAEAINALPR